MIMSGGRDNYVRKNVSQRDVCSCPVNLRINRNITQLVKLKQVLSDKVDTEPPEYLPFSAGFAAANSLCQVLHSQVSNIEKIPVIRQIIPFSVWLCSMVSDRSPRVIPDPVIERMRKVCFRTINIPEDYITRKPRYCALPTPWKNNLMSTPSIQHSG